MYERVRREQAVLEKVIDCMKERDISWTRGRSVGWEWDWDGKRVRISRACMTGAIGLAEYYRVITVQERDRLTHRLKLLTQKRFGIDSIQMVNDGLGYGPGWDFDKWLAEYKAAYPEETVDTEAIKDLIESAEINAVSV